MSLCDIGIQLFQDLFLRRPFSEEASVLEDVETTTHRVEVVVVNLLDVFVCRGFFHSAIQVEARKLQRDLARAGVENTRKLSVRCFSDVHDLLRDILFQRVRDLRVYQLLKRLFDYFLVPRLTCFLLLGLRELINRVIGSRITFFAFKLEQLLYF